VVVLGSAGALGGTDLDHGLAGIGQGLGEPGGEAAGWRSLVAAAL